MSGFWYSLLLAAVLLVPEPATLVVVAFGVVCCGLSLLQYARELLTPAALESETRGP